VETTALRRPLPCLRREGTEPPIQQSRFDKGKAQGHFCPVPVATLPLFSLQRQIRQPHRLAQFLAALCPNAVVTKLDFQLILPRTANTTATLRGQPGACLQRPAPSHRKRYCNNGVALNFHSRL